MLLSEQPPHPLLRQCPFHWYAQPRSGWRSALFLGRACLLHGEEPFGGLLQCDCTWHPDFLCGLQEACSGISPDVPGNGFQTYTKEVSQVSPGFPASSPFPDLLDLVVCEFQWHCCVPLRYDGHIIRCCRRRVQLIVFMGAIGPLMPAMPTACTMYTRCAPAIHQQASSSTNKNNRISPAVAC